MTADKEQLGVARALIIKQKEEMLALVKKMRQMHAELKELRSKSSNEFIQDFHCKLKANVECQTETIRQIAITQEASSMCVSSEQTLKCIKIPVSQIYDNHTAIVTDSCKQKRSKSN